MKKCIVLLFLLTPGLPVTARAQEEAHRKAVEELLEFLNMEAMLSESIQNMLEIQVQQNPALQPFRDDMSQFLHKYMSWDSLKPEVIELYRQEFTEEEIREISAFYHTPTGRRVLEKMPVLMSRASQLGSNRVQEHQGELIQVIQEKLKQNH